MKQLIFILVFIFGTSNASFAQLDNSKSGEKGKSIGTAKAKAKTVKKPEAINFGNKNGFKVAHKKEQEKLKRNQKQQARFNREILSQKKLAEEKTLKALKKINGRFVYPVIDQDLGSIRTNSKSIKIICRDFQYPDGDRVTIYINDIPLIPNILLKQSYQTFEIPLDIGINKIAFKALNQGTSGPNTAAFKVYNDAGMLLSSNEWNLATGAKATLLVAKDK